MKLTKENICVKNSKKNRELIDKFNLSRNIFTFTKHGIITISEKSEQLKYVKHKHLKAILDGKDVQLVDGKVVVNGEVSSASISENFDKLKEAHKNAVVNEYKRILDIKIPEQNNKPKVGDVVTNGRLFKRLKPMSSVSSGWYKVSQQEVIDLLFKTK